MSFFDISLCNFQFQTIPDYYSPYIAMFNLHISLESDIVSKLGNSIYISSSNSYPVETSIKSTSKSTSTARVFALLKTHLLSLGILSTLYQYYLLIFFHFWHHLFSKLQPWLQRQSTKSY